MPLRLIVLFLFFTISIDAQDIPDEATPMRIVRCDAISQTSTVRNIFVDKSNNKWAATNSGIFKIHSADNATKEIIPPNSWSLLRFRGGNEMIHFDRERMSDLFLEANEELIEKDKVTTSYLDKTKNELWVGTSLSGVYQFKVGDNITLLNQYNTKNSKMKSDYVNSILIDKYSRFWIGTKNGVLYGHPKKGKIKHYEPGHDIIAITDLGPHVWILGNDVLWQIDDRNRWIPGSVDKRCAKGEIKDIEYDSEGRLWVASEIIVRYDVVNNTVEKFDRSNGFNGSNINVIQVDREDALWVGTENMGMYLIEKETVMTVSCAIEKGLDCNQEKNDATLSVKVVGGKPPYQYSWSNNDTSDNPKNLGPGTYEVTVTDSEGNKRSAKAQIDKAMLIAAINLEEAAIGEAANGSATVEVTGGVPDYDYKWDNGESKAMANKLTGGKHSVMVIDKMGCTTTVSIEIPTAPEPAPEDMVADQLSEEKPANEVIAAVAIIKPTTPKNPPLSVKMPKVMELKCGIEMIKNVPIEVTGGKSPYTYIWSDPSLSTYQFKAGNFNVTVTDANNSTATTSFTVKAPPKIEIAIKQTVDASKASMRDGLVVASAKGGTGQLLWQWDNGETKSTARKLNVGKHKVTVSDANGCKVSKTITIKEKAVPELRAETLKSGQTIQLKKLYFEADSKEIQTPSHPTLNEVARFLNANPKVIIEVGGHTNNIPAHDFCDRLSTERAKAVADFLIAKGVNKDRVVHKGYGKRKPLTSNKTKVGRAKNQRVELKILSF